MKFLRKLAMRTCENKRVDRRAGGKVPQTREVSISRHSQTLKPSHNEPQTGVVEDSQQEAGGGRTQVPHLKTSSKIVFSEWFDVGFLFVISLDLMWSQRRPVLAGLLHHVTLLLGLYLFFTGFFPSKLALPGFSSPYSVVRHVADLVSLANYFQF